MPLFFFDVDDGESRMNDDIGTELAGPGEAREEAIGLLPNIAAEQLPNGDRRTFVVKVRDADGRSVFLATLSLIAEWIV